MRARHLTVIAAVALFAAFGPAERTTPTKWALVIGISDYINFGHEIGGDLPGAANDARSMADVLVNRYGFEPDHVKVILDRQATRAEFQKEFTQWLPSVVKPGDLVVFFYAGHGSQAWDLNGDEPDGLDETICPSDVLRSSTQNDIIDDEMGIWLRGIPTDNIVVIWDKCHAQSSTRAVTPFAWPRVLGRNIQDVPRPANAVAAKPGTTPPPASEDPSSKELPGVLEIAASLASQVAMGAAFPTKNGVKYGGAFTTNFVQNLWNAPEGATYEQVFKKTKEDVRRERFTQVPAIDQEPAMNRVLFSLGEPPATPAAPGNITPAAPESTQVAAESTQVAPESAQVAPESAQVAAQAPAATTTAAPEIGFVPILGLPTPDSAVLGGGSMADMTERSLYKAGHALLRIDRVMPEKAQAFVVSKETRGITVVAKDALQVGSRARLVAYRYPDQILRVSIVDLPSVAQDTLRQRLMNNPALDLVSQPDAFAQYIIRPRGDYYVVLNQDGFPRDSVDAPDAAIGAKSLVPVLQREFQAFQLAGLENPAAPFKVDFEFANGSDGFQVGDTIEFRIRSERVGYLTLVDVEPDGKTKVLFPNELDQDNHIQAGQEVVWPTPAMKTFVYATPPTGHGIVRAFVTERPMLVPLSLDSVISAQEVWHALRNAAGQPPVAGSDAVPVENWATRAIPYEVKP